jgi:hypothetical protein
MVSSTDFFSGRLVLEPLRSLDELLPPRRVLHILRRCLVAVFVCECWPPGDTGGKCWTPVTTGDGACRIFIGTSKTDYILFYTSLPGMAFATL